MYHSAVPFVYSTPWCIVHSFHSLLCSWCIINLLNSLVYYRFIQLPGNYWCIIQLGVPGKVQKVEIDTIHFKGNYPESCMIESCSAPTVFILSFSFFFFPSLFRSFQGQLTRVLHDTSPALHPRCFPFLFFLATPKASVLSSRV